MYLNCHSYFSLHYGTLSVEQLVNKAFALGIKILALTDINNSTGMVYFVKSCRAKGIKPVAGMEFRLDNRILFIGLAINQEGFGELNHYLTQINLGKAEIQEKAPDFKNVFVIYPLENLPEIFRKNEFVGIRPSQAGKLLRTKLPQNKLVVLQPVTFASNTDYDLHKNLRAIDHNLLLSQLKPDMYAPADEIFLSPDKIEQTFKAFPEVVSNSHKLLAKCEIDFDFSQPKNKKTFTGSLSEDKKLLEKLAFEGLEYRYENKNKAAKKALTKRIGNYRETGIFGLLPHHAGCDSVCHEK